MQYVKTADGGLQFPGTSVTGDAAVELLDTGWDVHFDGPGHIYLSDRDLVDIVVPALEREAVTDALKTNGWTAPGDKVAAAADRDLLIAKLQGENAALEAKVASYEDAIKHLTETGATTAKAPKAPAKSHAKSHAKKA